MILNIADFILIGIATPTVVPLDEQTWFVTYDAVANGILLMIVYAVVLYFLMQPLKSFQERGNDFSAQKRNIIQQFVLFEIAYVVYEGA